VLSYNRGQSAPLGATAFCYIVPDQYRDMHGIGNLLALCGGEFDADDNDIKRGDDETGWLVNEITGSRRWQQARNAIFVVFDERNGPLTCPYDPDAGIEKKAAKRTPRFAAVLIISQLAQQLLLHAEARRF